jgi:hypothetical protein
MGLPFGYFQGKPVTMRWALRRVRCTLLMTTVVLLGIIGVSLAPELRKWGLPQPIVIPDAQARWINDREFDVTAPTFYWNDTCPSIWVTWWVQTRENGAVPITTYAVSGPFAARGELPPRYQISIEPRVGPPLHLRGTIPSWLDKEDVLLVAVDDTVPDNEPCESGWSGVMQVFRLQVEPLMEASP